MFHSQENMLFNL